MNTAWIWWSSKLLYSEYVSCLCLQTTCSSLCCGVGIRDRSHVAAVFLTWSWSVRGHSLLSSTVLNWKQIQSYSDFSAWICIFRLIFFAWKVFMKGLDASQKSTQWAFLTALTLPDRCILGKQGYTLSIQVDSRDENYAGYDTQEFKLTTANVHKGASYNVFTSTFQAYRGRAFDTQKTDFGQSMTLALL